MPPVVLDLCCGTGAATAPWRAAGWEVIGIDLDPARSPDVIADLMAWVPPARPVEYVWASPPCTDYSREAMPWCRTGVPPCTDLVRRCLEIIASVRPRGWTLENVRGSIRWLRPILGEPVRVVGPYALWGTTDPGPLAITHRKQRYSGRQRHLRSQVDAGLAAAVLRSHTEMSGVPDQE